MSVAQTCIYVPGLLKSTMSLKSPVRPAWRATSSFRSHPLVGLAFILTRKNLSPFFPAAARGMHHGGVERVALSWRKQVPALGSILQFLFWEGRGAVPEHPSTWRARCVLCFTRPLTHSTLTLSRPALVVCTPRLQLLLTRPTALAT